MSTSSGKGVQHALMRATRIAIHTFWERVGFITPMRRRSWVVTVGVSAEGREDRLLYV